MKCIHAEKSEGYFSVWLGSILRVVRDVVRAIFAVPSVQNLPVTKQSSSRRKREVASLEMLWLPDEGTAGFFLERPGPVGVSRWRMNTKKEYMEWTFTSVTGDLGLTLRAAAISCSWLTSSVMDSRSSGFTFSIDAGPQGVERDKMMGLGFWSPKSVHHRGRWWRQFCDYCFVFWGDFLEGRAVLMRLWYTVYLASFWGMEYFPLTICSLAPSSNGCCLKHSR